MFSFSRHGFTRVIPGLVLALASVSSQAANLTATVSQAAGASWTDAIWQTNGVGTAVSPVAGSTYECVSNGIAFGNNTGNTRIRNPTGGGLTTFPGDSLKLDTNTEIRFKTATGLVLNFPGVSGNAGLILNGGVLNAGDDVVFTVTGRVSVASQSYISPADNGAGAVKPLRGFNFTGPLAGGGTLVIMNGGTNTPQQISSVSNSFLGKWIVKAGWLQGVGVNSLGTNSITIDPNYVLPLSSSVSNIPGPAQFEVNYDLNSAGRLTLTNGGLMMLHQNCIFSSVNIGSTNLSNGTHPYAELAGNFPSCFAAGGSGSITVQPFGPPPLIAPTIAAQPSSAAFNAGTWNQLAATASGSPPLNYQWQKGTNNLFANLADGGDVSGSSTNTLTFGSVVLADAAEYRLIVTNPAGSATSQVATVTVILPPVVSALNPPAGATVSNLTQIQVTFSKNVTGMAAEDLVVAGVPANAVSGSGSNYVFTFTQPLPGTILVAWDSDSGITDSSGNLFDTSGAWTYTLLDIVPPVVSALAPPAGITVASLAQVEVTFSKPVVGVTAAALLINGQPATNVTGAGVGPYVFQFPQPPNGVVRFTWSDANGITDTGSPALAFAGGSWTDTLNPSSSVTVRINEFLAANESTNGLLDQFGNLDDWIELYNYGSNAVNLAGCSLTDNSNNPTEWIFPSVTLGGGQFLVVFASGLNLTAVGGTNELHTNFKLSRSGEYLALFDAESPPVALTQFAPQFPPQRNNYSYGYDSSNQLKYFLVPTPGAPNGDSSITGLVADVQFSVQRGFYDASFALQLTDATPGATVYYTTDGSEPDDTSTICTNALSISQLSMVRAVAYATNDLPSLIQTHTYIFLTNVLNQPTNPPGFPITSNWSVNLWPSDYGMDQRVVTNPLYSAEITTDLLALPALSIVMKTTDMFGPTGIYTNTTANSVRSERACSAELIYPDGTPGFQIDCGIQMHGGGSANTPMKHPFDLDFSGQYGAGTLNYQFFPDSPVNAFSGGLVLRSDYNNHWTHALSPYGSSSIGQRSRGGLVRDAFFKDMQTAMGDFSSHSRYVHLYINGLYWGVYNPCENLDGNFCASYLGGSADDYDTLKGSDSGLSVGGDLTAYNAMLSYNNAGLANLAQYNQIRQYLDVTQYADYMLLQFYGANQDWGTQQNWVAVRERVTGAQFEYMCWDDERTLEGTNDTPMGSALNSVSPSGLQTNLALNAEYRQLFADRAYKFMFNGGVLTSNRVAQIWLARSSQIYQAIVGESARWGDSVPGGKLNISPLPYPSYTTNTPYYSRDENWLGEQGYLLTNYFPVRTAIVLNQLRAAGLYPAFDPPLMNQFGGYVPPGFNLTMTSPVGTIYYTTNGVDPRVYGTGAVSPQAVTYSNALTLNNPVTIMARVWSGGKWSALADANFQIVQPLGSQPYVLTNWDAAAPPGSYPPFMQFYQITNSAGDPGLTDEMDSLWTLPYNLTNRSRINGLGAGGIAFINTSSTQTNPGAGYVGAAVLGLNTVGAGKVRVAWAGGTVTPNPRVYGLRLQYCIGAGSAFSDVVDAQSNVVEYISSPNAGDSVFFGPVTLPAATTNQPYVGVRWKYYYLSGTNGARAQLSVDNIQVTSGFPTPTSLAFAPTPAVAQVGQPFGSVSVRVLGNYGILADGYSGPVAIGVSGYPGAVSGTLTRTATNGVAVFNDLVFQQTGTWNLTATATGLASAVSSPILILVNAPLPFPLSAGVFSFTNWPALSAAATYPSNMMFYQITNSAGDPGLTDEMDSLWTLPYNLTNRSRINGLDAGGFSFINTTSPQTNAGAGYVGAAVLALDTTGQSLVRVTWTGGTVVTNNRIYAIRLQYRLGETNAFSDVLDSQSNAVEYVVSPTTGQIQLLGPIVLPSAVTNQPYVQLRWKYYFVSGTNNARPQLSVANIQVDTGQLAPGAPQPYNLSSGPYQLTGWDSNAPAGTFPTNMAFFQATADDLDPALNVPMDLPWTLPYNLTNHSRINGLGADGFSFLNTSNPQTNNGAGYAGAAVLALDTTGQQNIRVTWTGGTVATNSRIYAIRLQYRLGDSGAFTDVLDAFNNPVEYVRHSQAGDATNLGPITLSSAVTNQPYVQLRWKYYYVSGNNNARPQLRVNNINVLAAQPPVLADIPNLFVHLGQTIQFSAAVTNLTGQPLIFSLTNSPAGAAINPTNGAFVWAVTNVPAPGTNAVTVSVADNGAPPLGDTTTFLVFVQPPPQFASATSDGNGNVNFTFNSLPGELYQLTFKNNLNDPEWTPIGPPVSGTGGALTFSNSLSLEPQRFYRIAVTAQ